MTEAGASTSWWWLGLMLAAFGYLALSTAVGARLVVGRLAAERLADRSGLAEPLTPGSRSWSALILMRSMFLCFAVLCAALGPFRDWALAGGTLAALILAALGRVVEMIVAPRWPEVVLAALAWPLRLIDWTVGPLFSPLVRLSEGLVERGRRERVDDDEEAREEQLEEYIRDAEEGGILEEEEGELLREIVDAGDVTVREVMTPRIDIVAVGADDSLETAVARFQSSRHSRLLVHDGGLDRVVGVLPVRDLLAHLRPSGAAVAARELMRPVPHVPATKRVLELLRELQDERQQVAVVVDEYGATAGIVSLEDLVEEIVGEIRDEHEVDEAAIRTDEQGRLVADGLTPIVDLAESIGRDIQVEDVGTVGGLVFARLGRAPRLGDRVEVAPGVSLEVIRLRGRRIGAVRVLCGPAANADAS